MIQKFMKKLHDRGFKQKELESITGLSQAYISRLARGAKPSLETVILLADIFNVSTDEVLDRSPGDDINREKKEGLKRYVSEHTI